MPAYFTGDSVFQTTLSGVLVNSFNVLNYADEPTGTAHDPSNNRVFFSDDTGPVWIVEVNPGSNGILFDSDDIITSLTKALYGSLTVDSEGITFDTWQGHLFVSDGLGQEIWEIKPGTDGIFNGLPPAGDDIMTHFDTAALGIVDPESVEFNPDNGHLYIMSTHNGLIAETTRNGTLLRYIATNFPGLKKPAGLAYAPASANPAVKNFYIVDRQVDNNADPSENDGLLYEATFPPLMTPPNSVALSGPSTGVINNNYPFVATVSPMSTSLPLTYTWQATGKATLTHTNGLSDTTPFIWSTPGTKIITVTVTNGVGTPVKATTQIQILTSSPGSKRIYLPLIVK
jgi:hypothetical protein